MMIAKAAYANIYLGTGILVGIFVIAVLALHFSKRRKFPINKRYPMLEESMILTSGIIATTGPLFLAFADEASCGLYVSFLQVPLCFGLACFLGQAYLVRLDFLFRKSYLEMGNRNLLSVQEHLK